MLTVAHAQRQTALGRIGPLGSVTYQALHLLSVQNTQGFGFHRWASDLRAEVCLRLYVWRLVTRFPGGCLCLWYEALTALGGAGWPSNWRVGHG